MNSLKHQKQKMLYLTLRDFPRRVANRVQTMNNDIVKIDTLVSYAFNKHPNLDRLAANEGKEDARKD